MAGGDLDALIDALVAANSANIKETVVDFDMLAGIQLAGRAPVEVIRNSVIPLVLTTQVISAVAKNGIELKITVKVTTRSMPHLVVGGAGRETVLARVGEGIVTTVGSAESHEMVLENPDEITRLVLEKKLDKDTHYTIMSIDVADIDVGENIGAKLKIDQAEAEKRIAEANAEKRRAEAAALEQENSAKVQEMKAKVVEAEARIPAAIASALENGKLDPFGYYALERAKSTAGLIENLKDNGLRVNISQANSVKSTASEMAENSILPEKEKKSRP